MDKYLALAVVRYELLSGMWMGLKFGRLLLDLGVIFRMCLIVIEGFARERFELGNNIVEKLRRSK